MDRIVILIDMDCFFVQVEQRFHPESIGKPCAVAQYNGPVGGCLLAISYEARALGLKRGMFGKTAKSNFPELILFEVPGKRGKADLTRYRAASAEFFQCIAEHLNNVERASIDETYADITDLITSKLSQPDWSNSLSSQPISEAYAIFDPDLLSSNDSNVSLDRPDWIEFLRNSFSDGERYAAASALAYEVRQTILKRTGFRCSAGIAPNKTLAKLACSLNKPNKQTIVPPESAAFLLRTTPIRKIRNLGGKLGSAITERLGIQTLGQLTELSPSKLSAEFGDKTAQWLLDLSRGYDPELVVRRSIQRSIGCGKNFIGRSMLTSSDKIEYWLRLLAVELIERLVDDRSNHRRFATRLTLHVRTDGTTSHESSASNSFSRVLPSDCLREIGAAESSADSAVAPTDSPGPSTHTGCDTVTEHYSTVIGTIARSALSVMCEVMHIEKGAELWSPGITNLSFSAGRFCKDTWEDAGDIRTLFRTQPKSTRHHGSLDGESSETREANGKPSVLLCNREDSPKASFFKRFCTGEPHPPSQRNLASRFECEDSNSNAVTYVEHTTDSSAAENVFELEHDADSRSSVKSEPNAFFTSYNDGDWTVCEECGSRVSVWQAPEHSDFHLAQRLQDEWSSEQPLSAATNRTSKTLGFRSTKSTVTSRSRCQKPASVQKRVVTLDKFISKPPS